MTRPFDSTLSVRLSRNAISEIWRPFVRNGHLRAGFNSARHYPSNLKKMRVFQSTAPKLKSLRRRYKSNFVSINLMITQTKDIVESLRCSSNFVVDIGSSFAVPSDPAYSFITDSEYRGLCIEGCPVNASALRNNISSTFDINRKLLFKFA